MNTLTTRPITPTPGSAIDPRSEEVTWVAWRLRGALTVTDAGVVAAGAAVLARAAEALWLPGRLAAFTDLAYSPDPARLDVHLAVGVLGPHGSTTIEAEHVAALLDARLARSYLPFSAVPADTAPLLDLPPHATRHSALLRQKVVNITAGDTDLTVLTRFNPVLNSAEDIARTLATRRTATRFRATVLATEFGLDDRTELDEQLRRAVDARRDLDANAAHQFTLERVEATLADLKESFASPLLVAELAVASIDPLPETFLRAVGACLTSETDVVRRGAWTTVAGSRLLLGGFEIDERPDGHADALRTGVPLYGGIAPRAMRDVLTLTECPLAWPIPTAGAIPGLPAIAVKPRPRPATLTVTDPTDTTLGIGSDGEPVAVSWAQRTRHLFNSGITGAGKTTLFDLCVRSDIDLGRPFLIVDCHGPWYERTRVMCEEAGADPVCFDIHDPHTATLAPVPPMPELAADRLEQVMSRARLMADAVTSHLPVEYAGPVGHSMLTSIFAAQSIFDVELITLLGWLGEPDRVREMLHVADDALPPTVRTSLHAMASPSSETASRTEWAISKAVALAGGPARRLLATPSDGTDPGAVLLAGHPVLINLAGLAPADVAVMGHVLLHLILDAVFTAGPDPARQIAVYVDEAHRLVPHNLERAWNEGRKFGLALALATQTPHTFPPALADVALSAGTVVAFRQAPEAANRLAPLLGVPAGELIEQPDLHAVVRVTGHDATTLNVPPYPPVPPLRPLGALGTLPAVTITPAKARRAVTRRRAQTPTLINPFSEDTGTQQLGDWLADHARQRNVVLASQPLQDITA